VFWARNQERKRKCGMLIAPQQINWAPISPFFHHICRPVREEILREVCKILQDHMTGKNLWTFRNFHVAHTLEFLSHEEQGLVLQIMKEHYGTPNNDNKCSSITRELVEL